MDQIIYGVKNYVARECPKAISIDESDFLIERIETTGPAGRIYAFTLLDKNQRPTSIIENGWKLVSFQSYPCGIQYNFTDPFGRLLRSINLSLKPGVSDTVDGTNMSSVNDYLRDFLEMSKYNSFLSYLYQVKKVKLNDWYMERLKEEDTCVIDDSTSLKEENDRLKKEISILKTKIESIKNLILE